MISKTGASIRTHLIAGLFIITPIAITYFALKTLFDFLREFFRPILFRLAITEMYPAITEYVVAALLALAILYMVGLLSRLIIVKRLIGFGENIVSRIPFIKFFYVTSKQVLDSIALMKRNAMNKVVVVEYPRKGIRSLAFVTGEIPTQKEGEYYVNIFLPSTPNPTTGYFLMLTPDEVFDVNLTMEEATKMLISGGILIPKHLKLKEYHPISPNRRKLAEMTIEQQREEMGL